MKLKILKDINGAEYLGIDIKTIDLDSNGVLFNNLLNQFYRLIPNSLEYNDNLLIRNNFKYHITVLNVYEWNKSNKQILFDNPNIFDVEFLGIGTAKKNDNQTWFVVVKSLLIDKIREKLGLYKKDLHITIGFIKKDISNVPKDEHTLI